MLMGPFIGGAFIVMVPFFLEKLADFAYILKGIVLIAVLLLAPAGVADLLARPFRALRRRQLAAVDESPGIVGTAARTQTVEGR